MYTFLAFGSIGFIILICLLIGGILYLIEFTDDYDEEVIFFRTLLTIAGFSIIYWFFGSKEDIKTLLSFVQTNPMTIFKWASAFVGIGIVWSFFKWFFYLNNVRDKLLHVLKSENDEIDRDNKRAQVAQERYDKNPESQESKRNVGKLKNRKPRTHMKIRQSQIPVASDRKSLIISWMSYWPLSMTWTLINDPFRKFFKYIFSKIGFAYEKMTERVFKNDETITDAEYYKIDR